MNDENDFGPCQGENACDNNARDGIIDGANACNATRACQGNSGFIVGDGGTCQGEDSCTDNDGVIQNGACGGDRSCNEVPDCVTLNGAGVADDCAADDSCDFTTTTATCCTPTPPEEDCCAQLGLMAPFCVVSPP